MTTLEVALGAATVVLALSVLVLAVRDGGGGSPAQLDEAQLQSSVGNAIAGLGLDGTAAQIETHAREMKQFHSDVEQMLRTPQHRGASASSSCRDHPRRPAPTGHVRHPGGRRG